MRMSGKRYAKAALATAKSPGTHCKGGRVEIAVGLNGYGEKIIPCLQRGLNTVQVVPSRYTDYGNPSA